MKPDHQATNRRVGADRRVGETDRRVGGHRQAAADHKAVVDRRVAADRRAHRFEALTRGPISFHRWVLAVLVIATLSTIFFGGGGLYTSFSNILQRESTVP
jgi:hypothetical protein